MSNLFQIRVLNHFVSNFCEKNIFKKKENKSKRFFTEVGDFLKTIWRRVSIDF